MRDATEKLMDFGLTRQEAKLYVTLLSESPLSGYEAAKRVGISRSNAYGALAGLVEKGAAYVVEEQAVQYQAVPLPEFTANKLHFLKGEAAKLLAEIPTGTLHSENYITIRGRRHVEDRFRNMLREARERVYLSVPLGVVERFRGELETLIGEGKKVVLLVEEDCGLPGAIVYISGHKEREIRLIADSAYALTGDLGGEGENTCLYSANPHLVKLLKEALANEIALIRLRGKDAQDKE